MANEPPQFTEEEMAEIRLIKKLTVEGTMAAMAEVERQTRLDLFPVLDGLVQVIATLVVQTGYLKAPRDEKLFARRMMDGILAHIKDAKNEARVVVPLGSDAKN